MVLIQKGLCSLVEENFKKNLIMEETEDKFNKMPTA